jgi:hypothetical protein
MVCTPRVDWPHNSGHFGGTVNVVVTETCVAAPAPAPPMQEIQIAAALYFNGVLARNSGYSTFVETYIAENNAAVPCASGTYQGWMGAYLVFPAGWVPQVSTTSGFGVARPITC